MGHATPRTTTVPALPVTQSPSLPTRSRPTPVRLDPMRSPRATTPSRSDSRHFSSYDRTGGNSDGFDGTYSELYVNAAGEHVIFDALGPGVLDTLWCTGPKEGGAGLDLGTIHFYLDDEPTPRIAIPWADLFSGDPEPFLAPLVTDNHSSTGAFVSWVPVPFARRLIVTTGVKPGFYQ